MGGDTETDRTGEEARQRSYWVAVTRAANYSTLREKGFVVYYPLLQDYVFLECLEKNLQMLEKAEDLGVVFLLGRGGYEVISQQELELMTAELRGGVTEGMKVRILTGSFGGLEGVVVQVDGERAMVEMSGWARKYENWFKTGEFEVIR